MAPRFGSLALVLGIALGCHDSPTAPHANPTPPPATAQLTNALAMSRMVLDDPLVAGLIAEADHTDVAKPVTRIMQRVIDDVTAGGRQIIGDALTDAQRELTQVLNDETMLARSALSLTLDALQTLLHDATTADSGTTTAPTNATRSP